VTPAEIASELARRVDSVVPELLAAARRCGGYWSCGSVEGEPGNSLYVHRTGVRIGKWRDCATDEFGDLIDLIRLTKRLDLHGACDWGRAFIGVTEVTTSKRGDDEEKGRRDALRIWRESVAAPGTPVEIYLRSRGIEIAPPPSLRFHPALFHPLAGRSFPAMVCAVSGPDRRLHAIQRVYLAENGAGKAEVEKPKLARGPLLNGAVRLAPATTVLGLCEGPETGMSVMQLHRVAVWCALGRRMDAVAIPETVARLVIFADRGAPGISAAEKAMEAHRLPGRRIEIVLPDAGFGDFNDMLRGRAAA
jgi:DNA primase